MYNKGVHTRNLIYTTAKETFYEKGYSKTTIKDIVTTADVPLGLFTYYFKTKDKVVQRIYSEFITKIDLRIAESRTKGITNSVIRHAVLSWIYYDIILNDSNNRQFYYETLKNKSNYRILNKSIGKIYSRYLEDFNLQITPEAFSNTLLVDFGARREVFFNYFENSAHCSQDELVFLVNGIVPRMFGINQEKVNHCLSQGIEIGKVIEHHDLSFLI
ncbi:MAG: TetR/AcrR family transcriptional regulator [Eubacteriaceae bacterium]